MESDAGTGSFPSTHWTVILNARDPESPQRRQSLDVLAGLYWRPVFAYFRVKWRRSREDAQDLTQEFFASLLEKDFLGHVEPDRGRFRGYLKRSLDNFAKRQHRDAMREKRGGGAVALAFDETFEPSAEIAPDDIFDHEWALSVFDAALKALKDDCEPHVYELLVAYDLEPADPRPTYDALAARFRLSSSDVGVTLFRARKKLRDLVLRTVRETASSEAEAEVEMRELFGRTEP